MVIKWVAVVIILDRVPVMAVKGKGDWCRFHVRAMSMPVFMDDASLNNKTHQEYEQHGNPGRIFIFEIIPGVERAFNGTHDFYSQKMADLLSGRFTQLYYMVTKCKSISKQFLAEGIRGEGREVGKRLKFPFINVVTGVGHTQFFIDSLSSCVIFFHVETQRTHLALFAGQ